MTFVPMSTAELLSIRKQRNQGWSIAACASHWRRSPEEVELAMWAMLGRWRQNITHARDLVNRRLAKRCAERAVQPYLEAA